MHDVGTERNAVNLETSLLHAFRHNGGKESLLVAVKILAHFFHHYDVAEELCPEVTIALNCFLYHVQVRIDDLDEFVFRLHWLCRHISHLFVDALQFPLDDRPIDLLLALEVGI